MFKIIFIVLAVTSLAFASVAIILAGRSVKQTDVRNIEKIDKMLWKKQVCSECKTGRDSYLLDEHSDSCPYIGCWKDGICQFYLPLEKYRNGQIQEK